MKHYRACICIGTALLFMALLFRPGCRILVNGEPLSGVYSLHTAYSCAAAARQAAQEITREEESDPFRLVPVFCLSHKDADSEALYHTLLNAYNGVQQLYAVYAGDTKIGLSSSPLSAVILQREFFPDAAREVMHTHTVYTYTGAENTLPELREAMSYVLTEAEPF